MNSTLGNRIYTVTTLSKNEILKNHISVLNTIEIPANETFQCELPCLYNGYLNSTKTLTNKDTLLDLVKVPKSPHCYSSTK